MSPTLVKSALGVALGFGLVLAARLMAWPLVHVTLPPSAAVAPGLTNGVRRVPIDSLVSVIVLHDPFRFTHRPAAVAYDPLRLAEQLAAPAPKPVLQLSGIVWEGGRDPTAVLEGLPGFEGVRVVRVDDLVGGLRIRSIASDAVRIVGMDTTWVLKLRAPWH